MRVWRVAPAYVEKLSANNIVVGSVKDYKYVNDFKIYGAAIGGLAVFVLSSDIKLSIVGLIGGISVLILLLSRIPLSSSVSLAKPEKTIVCTRNYYKVAFWRSREEFKIEFTSISSYYKTLEKLPRNQMEKIHLLIPDENLLIEFLFFGRNSDFMETLSFLEDALGTTKYIETPNLLNSRTLAETKSLSGIFPIDIYALIYGIVTGFVINLVALLYPEINERIGILFGITTGWVYSIMSTKTMAKRSGNFSILVTILGLFVHRIGSVLLTETDLHITPTMVSGLLIGIIVAWTLPRLLQFDWVLARPHLLEKSNNMGYIAQATLIYVFLYGMGYYLIIR